MVIVVGYHTYIVLEYVKFIYGGSCSASHVRSPRICTVYIWCSSRSKSHVRTVLEYAQFIYGYSRSTSQVHSPQICTVYIWGQS